MVIPRSQHTEHGMLSADLMVAMGLLVLALIPISASYLSEQKLCRAYYQRALAVQIIDGEMEVLAAGEWRVLREGEQEYLPNTEVMKNLPRGKIWFTRKENNLRLEWRPETLESGASIVREARGK